MIRHISRHITRPAAALAALALFSCSRDEIGGTAQPAGEEIAFVVSVPSPGAVATRAIAEGGGDDNDIREITLMLFDPATLAYERSVSATNIRPVAGEGNENRRTFRAAIPEGDYKALVLANAAAVVGAVYDLGAGTVKNGGGAMTALTMDDVEAALKRELPAGKYNAWPGTEGYAPFVMSSGRESVAVPGVRDYSSDPIRLARDVAKINVRFKDAATSALLAISEIRLYNHATESHAVPAAGWWSDDPSPLFAASGATRPATAPVGGTESVVYDNSDAERPAIAGNQCVDVIFTAERPAAAADNLCLLIRGRVTLDGTPPVADRWYKLEFRAKDPASDNALRHVNILRNYVYTVTISGVGNAGYASPEEALAHAAEGIETELTATPDEGMNDIVYNGEYQLAVDKSAITISAYPTAEHLRVFTDFADGWRVENTTYGAGGGGWLTFPQSGGGSTSTQVAVAATSENNTGASRTATVTLAAGKLRKTITVTQTPRADNHRITWNAASRRYVLTTDPRDAGLYFKFGGVAGLYSAHHALATLPADGDNDTFDAGDVAWSPTNISPTDDLFADWESVSAYIAAEHAGITEITEAYHTVPNVKKGMGDPCRLVGLDLDRIKTRSAAMLHAADIDNGTWRLPTAAENMLFTGKSYEEWAEGERAHWTAVNGVGGGMFPDATSGSATTFLPAAGYRAAGGAVEDQYGGGNAMGYYWTSTVNLAGTPVGGRHLYFGAGGIAPSTSVLADGGYPAMPVRCVKQYRPFRVGDYYPDPDNAATAIGVVFRVTDDGRHGTILSPDDGVAEWSTANFVTGADDPDDGLANTATIARYIAANPGMTWADFPAFEWIHNNKNGGAATYAPGAKGVWYLPAKNELKALAAGTHGMVYEEMGDWPDNTFMPGWDSDDADRALYDFLGKMNNIGSQHGFSAYWMSSTEDSATRVWSNMVEIGHSSTMYTKSSPFNFFPVMAF